MSKKVLLYSGGMDSWLIDKLWKPDIKLFFDIGTETNKVELERARKLDNTLIIDMPLSQFEQPNHNYYMPLRNLHFVSMAAHYGDEICIGAVACSRYKDNDLHFTQASQDLINYLLSEDATRETTVKVVAPYRDYTKSELLGEYIKMGGHINTAYDETFSCYHPTDDKECMNCTACFSKFTAFYNNGYKFTDEQIKTFVNNVLNSKVAKQESIELAHLLNK